MAKSRKKYSLNDRVKYHKTRLNTMAKKCRDSGNELSTEKLSKLSKKPRNAYSLGFVRTMENGIPLNYKEYTKSFQAGCFAAEKAKKKSANVKFK